MRLVSFLGIAVSLVSPQIAAAQSADCKQFAGVWRGQTATYEPVEFSVSADGATLTYAGKPVQCATANGRLVIKNPGADIDMGADGKGKARLGTRTTEITMKRS